MNPRTTQGAAGKKLARHSLAASRRSPSEIDSPKPRRRREIAGTSAGRWRRWCRLANGRGEFFQGKCGGVGGGLLAPDDGDARERGRAQRFAGNLARPIRGGGWILGGPLGGGARHDFVARGGGEGLCEFEGEGGSAAHGFAGDMCERERALGFLAEALGPLRGGGGITVAPGESGGFEHEMAIAPGGKSRRPLGRRARRALRPISDAFLFRLGPWGSSRM